MQGGGCVRSVFTGQVFDLHTDHTGNENAGEFSLFFTETQGQVLFFIWKTRVSFLLSQKKTAGTFYSFSGTHGEISVLFGTQGKVSLFEWNIREGV